MSIKPLDVLHGALVRVSVRVRVRVRFILLLLLRRVGLLRGIVLALGILEDLVRV